ncbi:MAG: HAMP domain-containing protein, partial [Comamonadaceae bacterium]
AQQMRTARNQRSLTFIEGLDDPGPAAVNNARIKALVVVPHPSLGLLAEPRFLQTTIGVPPQLVANALAVQEANREYQELALARDGLRRMYIGTLTLSLFLAVFGAVLLAIILGNQLARPLLLLAAGVSEVAAGDLSPKPALQGKDELGGLTRSFAEMTQQLADARGAVEKSMDQVSAARANLQTILDNLTAGVIVLDAQGRIQTSNPGATSILRIPLAGSEGRRLAELEGLEAFGAAVQQRFDDFLNDRTQRAADHWQQSFELNPGNVGGAPQANTVTLVARGAEMPGDARLLVFDDISEIVSAQRAQAWGEVARRLAHEIKNPLTPIQLSAERLEMKLAGKLVEPERALLAKSVRTIVDQVDSMKRLVNEFRDYARLPAAELKAIDLNALVSDVLALYGRETEAAHSAETLYTSAKLGIYELLSGGSTTILDMGTVRHTESIISAAKKFGIRGSFGKCLMDHPKTTPKNLREKTEVALQEAVELYHKHHGANGGRIRISFAPRFVVSCTEELLKEVERISSEFGMLVHTHACENQKEIELVREMTGKDNIDYLHALGLTGDRLVLAHCVWLTDREKIILKKTGTHVAHCPSSNLKLASGIAPIQEYLDMGISVALGADGAPCNNRLNAFQEMRLAAFLQKPGRGPK